jgi:hypothetical protein
MALWTKATSPRSPRRVMAMPRALAAFWAELRRDAGVRPGEAALALRMVWKTFLKKALKYKRRKLGSLRLT